MSTLSTSPGPDQRTSDSRVLTIGFFVAGVVLALLVIIGLIGALLAALGPGVVVPVPGRPPASTLMSGLAIATIPTLLVALAVAVPASVLGLAGALLLSFVPARFQPIVDRALEVAASPPLLVIAFPLFILQAPSTTWVALVIGVLLAPAAMRMIHARIAPVAGASSPAGRRRTPRRMLITLASVVLMVAAQALIWRSAAELLGYGAPSPWPPSWGRLMSSAPQEMLGFWGMVLPALAILAASLSLSTLGRRLVVLVDRDS